MVSSGLPAAPSTGLIYHPTFTPPGTGGAYIAPNTTTTRPATPYLGGAATAPQAPSMGVGASSSGSGSGAPSNPYLSDPGYQMALMNEQQGISTLNSQLNKEIAQRIIDYGDPALAAQAGFGLDSQSAAFARQNYLSGNSQLARLDKAHSLARQAVVNTLNGRGLLFSGDTGYQTGQADQAYGNNVYDAQHAALGDINNFRTATMDREQQLRDSVVQALEMAFQNYAQNGYGGGGGSTPSTGPTGSGSGGHPFLGGGVTFSNNLGPAPRGVSRAPKAPAPARSVIANAYTSGRKTRG